MFLVEVCELVYLGSTALRIRRDLLLKVAWRRRKAHQGELGKYLSESRETDPTTVDSGC